MILAGSFYMFYEHISNYIRHTHWDPQDFCFFNGWVIYGWNSENKPENQDKKTRKKIELTNILEKELNQIQNLTLPFSKKSRECVL